MTAMEVYLDDRQKRKNPAERLPRQEYFTLLRDTLHDELMRDGRSDFLDEMLAWCEEGKALPMLEFAALRECCEMIVERRPMQDASEYVPHIFRTEQERFSWRELEAGGAYRVDDPEAARQLARLRNVSQQLVSMRDETLAPDVNRAAQRRIDGLLLLNRTLEADAAALRQERDELRARLAALEEGYITRQLENRLEVRRRQAESDLEQELALKRQEAEAAMRRALEEAAEKHRSVLRESDVRAQVHAEERAAEYAALRDGMQDCLRELQSQLDRQLGAWQTQLHAADHRFLAGSFAALSGMAARETTSFLAMMQEHGAEEAVVSAFAALQARLDGQLRQMEQAMSQLGLRLFWPEKGGAFDPGCQSPVSASGGAAEALVITAVESPGVMLRRSASQAEEILVRAVVHTEMKETP